MKVNMTPNPLDVVTIHASQGDTEARQWEFELHNNGEQIDTSEITEQLFFKSYKGGTEEILPENGSVPTTSPIIADIKYPQGLLSDQEFLYRQSPTEEDGLAKITDIKGNTIVWNQIFIPQYRSNSGIQVNVIQDGNDYSVRIYGTSTANAWLRMDATGTLPVGHKFLLDKGSTSDLFDINNDIYGLMVDFSAKTKIGTVTTADKYIYIFVASGTTIDVTVKPMLIDLTQMGLDSLTDAEILQWFADYYPLPYYSYNQGTLLSFNGNGIKTVSEDETEESTLSLPISTYFPNGMKSAGNVYDELTETKAITRIGSRAYQSGDESDTSVITDGTTTYYVLATPTETSFTTASLVTENAEIPLSNNDSVLIGKCTEELSENPGFFDAKIKLADDDGECYSNKIQLHVERSPQ